MCFWWAMAESRAALWRWFGVQMWTMSIWGFSVTARKSVPATSTPIICRAFSAVSSRLVMTWVIRARKRHRIVAKRQVQVPVSVNLADHAEAENADVIGFHSNFSRRSDY